MLAPEEELKNLQKELKWISEGESSFLDKVMSKGVYGFLVPLGCLTTMGVLSGGLYNLMRRDGKKQQIFMRYRILAQGITLCLAMAGIFQYRKS